MGAVCCCLYVDDNEEQQHNANTSVFSHFNHFSTATAEFARVCGNLFPRTQTHAVSSPSQVSITNRQDLDDSACDTFRCPPRPLAYDDPRCSPRRHQVLCEQGKGSSHCHNDTVTLKNTKGMSTCAGDTGEKLSFFGNENEHELQHPESSSLQKSSAHVLSGIGYLFTSSEDEDSCPICLEEYTTENPCITLHCTHEFHLGCLYEWMERSDDCPICGKVMVFNEAT